MRLELHLADIYTMPHLTLPQNIQVTKRRKAQKTFLINDRHACDPCYLPVYSASSFFFRDMEPFFLLLG